MRLITSLPFLVLTTLAAHAQTHVTYTDGDFASWSASDHHSINGSTSSAATAPTGGNPGAVWTFQHQVTTMGSITALHEPLDPAATFDPVSQGPFDQVEISFEADAFNSGVFGNVIAFTLGALQGGRVYVMDCSYTLVFANSGWQGVSGTASAGEFVRWGGGGPPLDLESGGPVRFVFLTSNSTGHGGGQADGVVDNFEVRLRLGSLLGAQSCQPTVGNSVGARPAVVATGSDVAGGNPLHLASRWLPTNTFGYFLGSRTTGMVVNAGGSQGTLCLGGSVGRFDALIQNSGATGVMEIDVDTTQVPQPTGAVAIAPGETWHFQLWYRDANPGTTSNFSGLASVTFQ